MNYKIYEVEAAINFWRNQPVNEQLADNVMSLGKEARCLADVYGLMIAEGRNEIADTELKDPQKAAMEQALTKT